MKRVLLLIVLLAGVSGMQGQTTGPRPNFTGTWKMDVAQSDFGGVPAPLRQTEVFTQSGDDFRLAVTSEREELKQSYTLGFKADGVEAATAKDLFPEGARFKIVSVKGEWQGAALVLTEKITVQGAAGSLKANYTLSGDGKVLTKTTHLTMEMGELDTKAIYNKQ